MSQFPNMLDYSFITERRIRLRTAAHTKTVIGGGTHPHLAGDTINQILFFIHHLALPHSLTESTNLNEETGRKARGEG